MFHRQWSWESESLLSLKHLYIGMGIYMGTEEYMYWESKESGLRWGETPPVFLLKA